MEAETPGIVLLMRVFSGVLVAAAIGTALLERRAPEPLRRLEASGAALGGAVFFLGFASGLSKLYEIERHLRPGSGSRQRKNSAHADHENPPSPSQSAESVAHPRGPRGREEDPLYVDAVRFVIEVGEASTSTLQRRLRIGYGRAAQIMDTMQDDGIIGPPEGSQPREVLKRPEWLDDINR